LQTDCKKIVAIFGTGKAVADDEVFQAACEIGAGLAEKGFIVANGGYGGTMLAAAKGAAQAVRCSSA
jgi:predicted Rossmann-fold nucleotide-binding protein